MNPNHDCTNCPVLDLLCGKKCSGQQNLTDKEKAEVNDFIQTDMNEIPNRKTIYSDIDVFGSAIEKMTDDQINRMLASLQKKSSN